MPSPRSLPPRRVVPGRFLKGVQRARRQRARRTTAAVPRGSRDDEQHLLATALQFDEVGPFLDPPGPVGPFLTLRHAQRLYTTALHSLHSRMMTALGVLSLMLLPFARDCLPVAQHSAQLAEHLRSLGHILQDMFALQGHFQHHRWVDLRTLGTFIQDADRDEIEERVPYFSNPL